MNILNKTKCYTIGPMQYEEGRKWRQDISIFLNDLGVTVFDPYEKPFIDAPLENEETHAEMQKAMELGQYDLVSSHFKKIRFLDLSMVDRADFLICYINPNVFTAGSIEELSWAVRLKRPIFLVVEGGKQKTPFWIMGMMPHKYIYDSFVDVKKILLDIHQGKHVLDSDRWRLLRDELR